MRRFFLTMMAFLTISLISCEKDDSPVLKNLPKEELKQCRGCDGTWDLLDTIP